MGTVAAGCADLEAQGCGGGGPYPWGGGLVAWTGTYIAPVAQWTPPGKYDCGSKLMVPFWGRCTTHIVYFSGDWDVHWGYGILTNGHMCVVSVLMSSGYPRLVGSLDCWLGSFWPSPPSTQLGLPCMLIGWFRLVFEPSVLVRGKWETLWETTP